MKFLNQLLTKRPFLVNYLLALTFLIYLFSIPLQAQVKTAAEIEILKELGLDETEFDTLVILGVTAHNDWDWIGTFENFYYHEKGYPPSCQDLCCNLGSIEAIFTTLFDGYDENSLIADPAYKYDLAEISFLKYYAEKNPGFLESVKSKKLNLDNLYIVGGGMTSPSSLLSHGEAFIRNQLLGTYWVQKNLPPYKDPNKRSINYAWLPDDFALDPNLPAILEASNLNGVGFARVAGYPEETSSGLSYGAHTHGGEYKDMEGSPGEDLLEHHDLDFYWSAPDKSITLGHWLAGKYSQLFYCPDVGLINDILDVPCYANKGPCQIEKSCLQDICTDLERLEHAYHLNQPVGKTRYVYIPVSNDAMAPPSIKDITTWINTFNSRKGKNNKIVMVQAAFDQYARLVEAAMSDQSHHVESFVSGPVAEGMYASCPYLKIKHLEGTQSLLGAEIFQSIVKQKGGVNSIPATQSHTLAMGWDSLVPSTHHAYVTGLSTQCTYIYEQKPVLDRACFNADEAKSWAINEIAENLKVHNVQNKVVVFNQLGFEREGLVELHDPALVNSITPNDAIQILGDTSILFRAKVPSMGYKTFDLTNLDTPEDKVIIDDSGLPNKLIIKNNYLTATLTKDQTGWYVSSIKDQGVTELVKGKANQLKYYDEIGKGLKLSNHSDTITIAGDTYSFRYENNSSFENQSLELESVKVARRSISHEILERGPLRVRIRTTMKDSETNITYHQEYSLVAGEPYLQMKTHGRAPDWKSLFVSFPLEQGTSVDTFISYGTPYHWIEESIRPGWPAHNGWKGPFMKPTFGFATVETQNKQPIASMFHKGVPAWGVQNQDNSLTLYGVLHRVVGLFGCDGTGWRSSQKIDTDYNTLEYAFRVPTGLKEPSSGYPNMESMSYQVPLTAQKLSADNQDESAPGIVEFSLASIQKKGNEQPAILMVGKQGIYQPDNLYLRVYHPNKTPKTVTVDLFKGNDGKAISVHELTIEEVSALEQPYGLHSNRPISLPTIQTGDTIRNPQFTFPLKRSITTLQISKNR